MLTKFLVSLLLLDGVLGTNVAGFLPCQENGQVKTLELATVTTEENYQGGGLGPEKISDSLGMKVTARSAAVVDEQTGKLLFEKNVDQPMAMASLTKVMTALVALDEGIDFSQTVTIGDEVVGIEGAKVEFKRGEVVTLDDVIYGMIMKSGNDAAVVLAKVVGGGDIEAFVRKMNAKAEKIGMANTRFKNPNGLDEEGHYSSAADMARLFIAALEYPKFEELIQTTRYDINVRNTSEVYHFGNTNKLLGLKPEMVGGKTGFTDNAGFCLLSLSQKEGEGRIVTVVLGSDLSGNQFQDSKALIDWTYWNYEWLK